MKLREHLSRAARELAGIADDPGLEAELLLASLLRLTREQLLAQLGDEAPAEFDKRLRALLAQRTAGKPLSLLRGEKRFMGILFHVEEGVFIPRYDSERLVEHVLERKPSGARLLEIGCGTGAIGLALARLGAYKEVHFTDISLKALALTEKNAWLLGVSGVRLHLGDLYSALPLADPPQKFDVIVSNPPYIPEDQYPALPAAVRDFEPRDALVAGDAGLSVIKRLIAQAPVHLAPDGLLALEIGSHPHEAVRALFRAAGFREIQAAEDSVTGNRFVSALAP